MDIQVRRQRMVQIQDQENVYSKKINVVIPTKRQGLAVRGALGELNTNVQVQRDVNVGKVAVAAAEFEKKATRGIVRSNYSHVQSKVNTGLAAKTVIQPSSRPPLRREESTAALAARAVVRTRAALKDVQNKPHYVKESNPLQAKKVTQDIKKPSKLISLKDNVKESKGLLRSIPKEPTESLGKLKLGENDDNVSLGKQENVDVKILSPPKLPEDIEDIDASDKNSPLLMSIYIKDIYKYLTHLEEKYPIEEDHLRKQSVITGKMRATLIDWLAEVQRQFSFVLETFHLTVGIIDRYLQVVPNVQRNQLQLVGVTAMFIASKYEEIHVPDVSDFVYVTDNAYSKSDVFQCEREIMSKLGFCLARPIPLSFLRRFVKAAHGTSKNHHLAKYFVDLSLVEYSMAHYRPSELAASAICLSLYLLSSKKLSEVWTPTLSYYSGYSLEHIVPIMVKIAKIVISVENSKHKAVYNMYSDTTVAKVSSLPQLKGDAIYELTKITSC
ncbi:G2/mitotic-specific cyclin-B [Vanessa atalanta]|uniref:G2/mitotic-specific cyclin-B n=1 Tax=Vanessa atalanta TaxID=42275 RepID=UPI001FCDAA68|nr:G2/mitotic-specific cyclin-B [Vanessa atalanta]